jgi:hypothetical protein
VSAGVYAVGHGWRLLLHDLALQVDITPQRTALGLA